MMQGLLNPRKVSEVQELQEAKALEFTSRLAHLPMELHGHVRWYWEAFAITMLVS